MSDSRLNERADIGFVLRATGQWTLWVFTNLLGFFNAWAMARSLGLTLSEEIGADIGDNGLLEIGLQLGSPAGAVAFVVVFQSVLMLFHWPVLRVWGETGMRVDPTRGWLWRALLVFFVVSFLVGMLVGSVVAPAVAPILAQPLFMGLIQGLWIALLWAYLRRRLPSVRPAEMQRLRGRTAWIFVATLGIAVVAAMYAEPWIGGGRCVFCGTVPAAGIGVQFGAFSGIVLLWQFRARKASPQDPLSWHTS